MCLRGDASKADKHARFATGNLGCLGATVSLKRSRRGGEVRAYSECQNHKCRAKSLSNFFHVTLKFVSGVR